MNLLIIGGTSSIGNFLLKKLSKSNRFKITATFANSKPQLMVDNLTWVPLKFNLEKCELVTEVKKDNYDFIIHLNGFNRLNKDVVENSNVFDYWNKIKNYFNYFSGMLINVSSNAVYQSSKFILNEESNLNLQSDYAMGKIYYESSQFKQMNLRGAFFPLSRLGTGKLPYEIYYAPQNYIFNLPANLKWNGVTSLNLAEIIFNITSNELFRVGNFNIFSLGGIDYYEYVKALLFFYERKDIILNLFDSDPNQNLVLNTMHHEFNEKLWSSQNYTKIPQTIQIIESIKRTKFRLQ